MTSICVCISVHVNSSVLLLSLNIIRGFQVPGVKDCLSLSLICCNDAVCHSLKFEPPIEALNHYCMIESVTSVMSFSSRCFPICENHASLVYAGGGTFHVSEWFAWFTTTPRASGSAMVLSSTACPCVFFFIFFIELCLCVSTQAQINKTKCRSASSQITVFITISLYSNFGLARHNLLTAASCSTQLENFGPQFRVTL